MRKDCYIKTCLFRPTFIFILVVLLVGIVLPSKISSAQSSVGPGVDLIILIDQSGSMSYGVRRSDDDTLPRLPPTDPDQRRIYTAQYLIDYMAFDNSYVNPIRTNRVLVIGFGSSGKTHVMVPLTPLNNDVEVKQAKSLINAEYLGETSFLSAFELIRQEFPSSTDDELVNGLRRRSIVVITDGGPYEDGPVDFDEYFAKLGAFYSAELGTQHYPTYVIGIDKNDVYWSRVEHLWENHVTGKGNAQRVNTVDEVNKKVVQMICPFLNSTGTGTECRLMELGDHFIPPYAQSVSFSFFKYDINAHVTLYRPMPSGETGGKEVVTDPADADVLDYKATPRDQFYVMGTPTPGCWRSERRGTGKVDVFTQIVFNDMLMVIPASRHPVIAPLEFEFLLQDAGGNPIDELGDFPISLNAELTSPDGVAQPVAIEKVRPGLYASRQGVLPRATGTYTLTLEGTTTIPPLKACLPSGGTDRVFAQSFQVPIYAPGIVVSEPASPYYHYGPLMSVTVLFVDESGNPLTASADPLLSAELVLESPTGDTQVLGDVQPDGNGFRSNTPLLLPASGVYTVTTVLRDPSSNQVYAGHATFEVVDAIETVRPGPNYPALAPLRFVEIVLRDGAGQPVSTDPNYPLRIEATMIWPDGSSKMVELTPTTSPGRYRAPADWPLTEVAPHTLEIVGYTSLQPGLPEERVFVSRKVINVSSNLPFYRVVVPDEQQPGHKYPLHRWFLPPLPLNFAFQPQPVRVELWYGNRLGRAQDFFVGDVNDLFHLTVVGPAGEVIVDGQPLSDSTGEGSVFATALPELRSPGVYTASIALVGQVRGGVATQGAWPDAIVPFERRDPVVYLAMWATLSVLLLAALGYFGGGWMLNAVLLPKAKGKLIAETAGISPQALWELPITGVQRHHFTVKERRIDARLGLVRVEIRRATPQRRRGREGREEVEQGVEIAAYNDKGMKVANGTVYKSRPSKLPVRQRTSDNQSYQFRYEV